MNNLSENFLHLETLLLSNEVRTSKEKLQELICENFIEYCSSGKIFYYHEENIFAPLTEECQIVDFSTVFLSEDIILAKYKLIKITESKEEHSLRSSIWKKSEGQWKLFFHQGTICDKS